MSKGINKVIIIGIVGKDPEIKPTANNFAICNFSVATSESWKDKQSGEKIENTEWHNITMFGKLAEITQQYVTKGTKIYIEGKLKTEKWKDKETGVDRYKTNIIANEMQILSSKNKDDKPQNQQPRWGNEEPKPEFKDDDIPF